MKTIENDGQIIRIDELEDYEFGVGYDFQVADEDGKVMFDIHPFYFEDEYCIEPDTLGGFDVNLPDGTFLGVLEPDEMNADALLDL